MTEDQFKETTFYHAKIKDWPEDERPREKLMAFGSDALSDAELLAILIGSGIGKITAVDIAKTLLVHFENLSGLARRTVPDLQQFKGIGEAKAVTLLATFEIARRIQSQSGGNKIKVGGPKDIADRYIPLLRDLRKEVFKVVLLDSANHILKDVTITEGTLNSSLVHPREIFHVAVQELAASIILLHNHPSGEPKPSKEDIAVTKQLVDASSIMGVPIHDHIIIAGNRFTSLKEKGLM